MNPSRKYLSRGKIRKRRQRRELDQRLASREGEEDVQEEFDLWTFLTKHYVEFLFIVVMILGVLAVLSLGPDRKASNKARDSVSAIISGQSSNWDQAYPHGYKIIALQDQSIIHTSYDTLPRELKINWKRLSVSRIQANQLNNTTEKIKIIMDDINYAPAGVSGLRVTAKLSRQKGSTASLAQIGEFKFVAKIVEDNGEYVFLIFGLR